MALGLNDNKAGMQGLDKARINAVIELATAKTKFGAHARRKQRRIQERVDEMKKTLESLSQRDMQRALAQADQLVERLERRRSTSRTVVHVDMDAFYAAVHMRDEPRLRAVPMAVGSDAMLSTSNYLARRFGVRAAMPGFIARKLCPELVLVPCDFGKYREAAELVRQVLRDYDPDLSAVGLDEAYLDLTDYLVQRDNQSKHWLRVRYTGACACRLPRVPANDDDASTSEQSRTSVERITCDRCGLQCEKVTDAVTFGGDVQSVVAEMRFRIEQDTGGLTASAGIACNSLLAKICSDVNKPNNQFRLNSTREDILKFMHDLPVRKVSGVGSVTETLLGALDVRTCGDAVRRRAELTAALTGRAGEFVLAAALGVEPARCHADRDESRKSVSVERTFSPVSDVRCLLNIVKELSARLAVNLADENYAASQITLKLKTSRFDTLTRAAPAAGRPLTSAEDISAAATRLLVRERRRMSSGDFEFRLLGVRASMLRQRASKRRVSHCESEEGVRRVDDQCVNGQHDDDDDDVCIIDITEASSSTSNGNGVNTSNDCDDPPAPALLEPCPVCNVRLPSVRSEEEMARHVDSCLSKRTIAEVLREQRSPPRKPKLDNLASRSNNSANGVKHRKLDSYFMRL